MAPMPIEVPFDPWELETALVYHRVFHYSLGIHVNHLVFLNTYLLGIFVALGSVHGAVLGVVALALSAHAFELAGACVAAPFAVQVAGLVLVAESAQNALDAGIGAMTMGLAVALASLLAQVAGHAVFEELRPLRPAPLHGLVCAPFLESVALQFRLGFGSKLAERVEARVAKIRPQALQLRTNT